MSLRVVLATLIVLATAGFVAGTTIERNSKESGHESAATLKAEGKTTEGAAESGGESKATHAAEDKSQSPRGAGASARASRHVEPQSNESDHESVATLKAEGKTTATHAEGGDDTKAAHTSEDATKKAAPVESSGESATTKAAEESQRSTETGALPAQTTQEHAELKPLGINVEAVPFVILAALASIALAVAAWVRPRMVLLLLGVASAMLVFALLDIREISHQSDESRTGLAVLAGAIAILHAGAAVVAGLMARVATRRELSA